MGLKLMIKGLGLRVLSSGFRAKGLEFIVKCFRV